MSIGKIKIYSNKIVSGIRGVPLPWALGAASVILAAMLIVTFELSNPQYNVLFEGLSPSRGGAVIAALQKLGIPYRLQNNGAEIQVPANDIGRARLQLADLGEPGREGGKDWGKLEKLPMTASQESARAIGLRAIESSIERSVMAVSAARRVRVMIAKPKDTPFLGDQPRVKASVVVVGAVEPDAALGAAIAKVVSAAVPGLAEKSVVIATQHGKILFPVSRHQDIVSQLAIQSAIESAEEAKIRSLLTPIFGAGNYRVAVSANVDFERKTIESDTYGPKSYPTYSETKYRKRVGSATAAIGIPGALSNQPPGSTTAPLNPPATAAAGAPQPQTKAVADTAAKIAIAKIPHSETKSTQNKFAIDHERTYAKPAGWVVHAFAVTVVINRSAFTTSIRRKTIRKMISASIAAPASTIDVSTLQFIPPSKAAILRVKQPIIGAALKAGLVVVGAIAGLFGLLLPLMRWIGRFQRSALVGESGISVEEDRAEVDQSQIVIKQAVSKINDLAQSKPAALASVLEKWLDENDAG